MKCVAVVVLMALAVANANIVGPWPYTYVNAPRYAVARGLPGLVRFAAPSAYYAAPQVVYSAPRLAPIPAPAPVHVIAAAPSVAVSVPNAAVYRASNPGVTHEAYLPGHSLSVLSENLELPPGASN